MQLTVWRMCREKKRSSWRVRVLGLNLLRVVRRCAHKLARVVQRHFSDEFCGRRLRTFRRFMRAPRIVLIGVDRDSDVVGVLRVHSSCS